MTDSLSPPSAAQTPQAEVHRLRWQCRRGMLELDLLLNDFLDRGLVQLSAAEQADLIRLLGVQDQTLQHWLIAGALPEEPAMRVLVEKIRALPSQPDSVT